MYINGRRGGIVLFTSILIVGISKTGLSLDEIQYFDVTPSIQEEYRYVRFYCIINPTTIRNVFITILTPRGIEIIKPMIWNETGKYLNYSYFNETGKYSFFITIIYKNGVRVTSQPKYFWITIDVNDIDNDGIPNWWEEKFYLNPRDPYDAKEDYDKDGFNNLEEYKLGLNPWEKNKHNINQIINQIFPIIYATLFLSLIYLIRYISKKIAWKKEFNIIASLGSFIIIVALLLSYIYKSFINEIFYVTMLLYCMLFVLAVFLFQLSSTRLMRRELFKISLQGKLYHFRCPICNGIFAVKESRRNGRKPLILRCPLCGAIGRIQVFHPVKYDTLPLEKSTGIHFTCNNCGEKLTVWAEGGNLNPDVEIFSCPFCGSFKPLRKV